MSWEGREGEGKGWGGEWRRGEERGGEGRGEGRGRGREYKVRTFHVRSPVAPDPGPHHAAVLGH